MEFRVLGPIELAAGRGRYPLSSARLRRVLAVLVAGVDTRVSTGRLINATWPGRPPTTARVQVQNCVGMLRRQLGDLDGDVTIERCGDGYRLTAPPESVDAYRFEAGIRATERQLAAGAPGPAAVTLRSALDLWYGAAFEDSGSCETVGLTVRLEELRSWAFEKAMELEIAGGHAVRVVADCAAWAAANPLRETAQLLLLDALGSTHRAPDGVLAFQRYRTRLDAEMGLQPSRRAWQMYQRLISAGPRHA